MRISHIWDIFIRSINFFASDTKMACYQEKGVTCNSKLTSTPRNQRAKPPFNRQKYILLNLN